MKILFFLILTALVVLPACQSSNTSGGGMTTQATGDTKLKVRQTGANAISFGSPLTWTLEVTNDAGVAVNDVVLTQRVPSGNAFNGATGGGTSNGTMMSWNIGSMAPGQKIKVDFTITGMTRGAKAPNGGTAVARGQAAG